TRRVASDRSREEGVVSVGVAELGSHQAAAATAAVRQAGSEIPIDEQADRREVVRGSRHYWPQLRAREDRDEPGRGHIDGDARATLGDERGTSEGHLAALECRALAGEIADGQTAEARRVGYAPELPFGDIATGQRVAGDVAATDRLVADVGARYRVVGDLRGRHRACTQRQEQR